MSCSLRTLFVMAITILVCTTARAQTTVPAEADNHANRPATQPATQPSLSLEAQALLDRVGEAYAKLDSLELAGSLAMEYDVAGQRESHRSQLSGSFLAPNRFRHELRDDALVISDGSKVFLYLSKVEKYTEAAAPEARAASAGLEGQMLAVLRAQNPSLFLALCEAPDEELTDEALSVTKLDDVQLDQAGYSALRIETEEQDIRVLIDPQTNLIRQMSFDLTRSLVERGVPQVKQASITIDYTTVRPGAEVAEEQFAWAPPQGATLVSNSPSGAGAGSGAAEGDAQALEGKAAPDFTLPDLSGKDISLKGLRGSVVVLDFWATWCGPCRASLPHLDQLHRDFSDAGVKVFAVNLKEDKPVAQKYIESNNLTLPVLLDAKGQVAAKFAVSGIPHTVVIDKRGVISKVMVGFGPQSAQQLREAVQQANEMR